MAAQRTPLSGIAYALGAFGVFATHDVVVKYLGGTYSPVQIVFFSVLFGFPILVFVMMRDAQDGSLRPNHPWWTALRTLASVLTAFLAFVAFSALPLAQVYAILFAAPLLITVMAIPVLGERVGWRRWMAVAVGLAGVMVVLRPGVQPLEIGHFAAMAAALFGALASVVVRKIGREERSIVLMLYPMMANFVVMGAALAFVYEPMPVEDLGASAVMSVLALTATALLIQAYRRAPAALVAPMQYSQILWALVFGYALFGETLDRQTLIGSLIVIASGLFIVLREARGPTSVAQPVLRTRSRTGTPAAPRVAQFLSAEERDRGR